jgi:ABC-type Fe3+/spermidine/putrescine transport system ATPase subunit
MTVIENVGYGLADLPKAAQGTRRMKGCGSSAWKDSTGGCPQSFRAASSASPLPALVLEPRVLLFDEPLSNLDAKLRRRMREDIRDLQQGLGLTSVYVTHDQEEALAVSDKIIVMNRARIAQEGRPPTSTISRPTPLSRTSSAAPISSPARSSPSRTDWQGQPRRPGRCLSVPAPWAGPAWR